MDAEISFLLPYQETYKGCSGWVDPSRMEFMVATKNSQWKEIFVHEASHVDQFVKNTKCWTSIGDACFLCKSTYDDDRAEEVFYNTMLIEHDCDIRALKKIKEYKLEKEIDVARYTQKANCYHAAYYYFHKYSCFYDPKKIVYTQEHLLKLFSSTKIESPKKKWREIPELGEFLKKYHKKIR
jgi:hypothetical protein